MREFPHDTWPRFRRSRSVALGLAAAACSLAGAKNPGERADRVAITERARAAPASAELVVVIDDAARLRLTPVGRALDGAVPAAQAGAFLAAWRDLSRTLGWSPGEMFDVLLGSRATLLARGLGGPDAQWVVVSEVASGVERRLRERLDVSPRRIASGSPILSVEHGRYELAISRRRGGAILALGPTGASGLFDEIALSLGSFDSARAGADAGVNPFAPLADGEVAALWRPKGCASNQTAMTLRVRDATVRVESVVVSDRLRGQRASLAPWPRGLFNRLADGALLAWVERTAAPSEGASAIGEFLGGFPALALGPEHTALVGDRVALLAVPEGDGMSIGLALALRSASSASGLVDGLASEMLTRCGEPAQDFAGLAPSAVRRVAFRGEAGESPVLRRCAGSDGALRWSFPASARPSPLAGVRDASLDEIPEDRGWVVVGLGPGAHARIVGAIDDSVRPCQGEDEDAQGSRSAARRWVSMGVVRPREILDRLGPCRASAPAPLVALASVVESGEWTFRLSKDETLVGAATFTFVPPPAPSAAGPAPSVANKVR